MKPIILYNDKFLDIIKADGISLFPFVIIREKDRGNLRTINHETIHFQQTLECGILLFYVIYVIEFLIKMFVWGKTDTAYRNISFEKEAYKNQNDLEYFKHRKRWNWIRGIFLKG